MTGPADPFKNDWRRRRRMVFWVLLYCAAMLAFCAAEGGDSRVRETIAYACAGLAAIVVLGYLGFPVWDDKNSLAARVLVRQQEPGYGGGYGTTWQAGPISPPAAPPAAPSSDFPMPQPPGSSTMGGP